MKFTDLMLTYPGKVAETIVEGFSVLSQEIFLPAVLDFAYTSSLVFPALSY